MSYQIDYLAGEHAGCSSQINIADRVFYVKLFSSNPSQFFSADQKGVIEKEISKNEFELWINVLADNEAQVAEILKKLATGKKY
jgi:hypothetical protein